MRKLWCKKLLNEKNITIGFVYSAKKNKQVSLNLAASNEFQVFCNGKFIAYGPMRAARNYSYIRTYTLFPDEKENIRITVLVCGAQINSYERINETPFFAAEVLSEGKVIARSDDFKAYRITDRVQKVQRYSFQRTFTESYRFNKDRISLIDGYLSNFPQLKVSPVKANKLLKENHLSEPDYHFIKGKQIEYGAVFSDPTIKTYRDRSLTGIGCVPEYFMFKESELEEVLSNEAGRLVFNPFKNRKKLIQKNRYAAYVFEKNSSGFFSFELCVHEKTVIYLLFDEIVSPKDSDNLFIDINRLQCCNAIKFILEEGTYSITSFSPYTAKYVRLAVTEGKAEINNFGMITYENPDVKLKFSCKDKDISLIVDAAKASFKQNAVDVLTDCPSRERAGWLCDSFFTARAEKFLTGENRVEKNFLNAMLHSDELPFAKGMMPMCYPADHVDGIYIPNWAMWYIVELNDYLKRSGDKTFVKKCRERVYGIINFLDKYLNEYGLLENLESWIFVEWSKANEFVDGVNFPSNMMYSFALKCAAEMFNDSDLAFRSQKMNETILALSYNGKFFVDQSLRDKDGNLNRTDNITETCQYYAFWTGTAKRELYSDLYRTMLLHFAGTDGSELYPIVYPSNAFVGKIMRLDYLLAQHEYNTVIEEIKTYYLPMAKTTGTLWENLTSIASCDHGFPSYIANILIHAVNKD